MYMYFILGWFGTVWWPGIEVDAPRPGGDPQPWWTRVIVAIIGGAAAVGFGRLVGTYADPVSMVFCSLAAGKAAAMIVAPLLGGLGRK